MYGIYQANDPKFPRKPENRIEFMPDKIRIGTRGSDLALWQAQFGLNELSMPLVVAVPEPASVSFVVCLFVSLAICVSTRR